MSEYKRIFLTFLVSGINTGINTLLPFRKEATTEIFIRHYKGKTAAVDASCCLKMGLTSLHDSFGLRHLYTLPFSVR